MNELLSWRFELLFFMSELELLSYEETLNYPKPNPLTIDCKGLVFMLDSNNEVEPLTVVFVALAVCSCCICAL